MHNYISTSWHPLTFACSQYIHDFQRTHTRIPSCLCYFMSYSPIFDTLIVLTCNETAVRGLQRIYGEERAKLSQFRTRFAKRGMLRRQLFSRNKEKALICGAPQQEEEIFISLFNKYHVGVLYRSPVDRGLKFTNSPRSLARRRETWVFQDSQIVIQNRAARSATILSLPLNVTASRYDKCRFSFIAATSAVARWCDAVG